MDEVIEEELFSTSPVPMHSPIRTTNEQPLPPPNVAVTPPESLSRPTSGNLRPLTARQLGLLLRLTPCLMYWLRDLGGKEGGTLIISSNASQDLLYILLHKMLDVANFSGDLTIHQVRELGDEFGGETMAAAVRKIVTEAEPQLVPPMIGFSLIKTMADCGDAVMVTPDPVLWGGILDGMSRTNFFVLAELCAILRDANMAVDASALVGPSIISRNVDFHGKFDETTSSQLASRTMSMLVSHCQVLFGRCAAPPSSTSALGMGGLGKRMAGNNGDVLPAIDEQNNTNGTGGEDTEPQSVFQGTSSGNERSQLGRTTLVKKDPRRRSTLPTTSTEDAALASKKNALKAFYQWRDESRVASVDDLFANHTFSSVAKGVFARYSILPPGWRIELDELAKKDPSSFTWYLPADAIPKTVSSLALPDKQRDLSSITNVIDEILDSELTFYETLHDVQQKYVSRVRAIAMGKEGTQACASLGMNAGDVENVFGWRLAQVIQTSSLLLSKLEVVNLVRTETLNPGGRAVHVAKAFDDIAQELSINYAPFVSGHQNSMQLLKRGEDKQKSLGDKEQKKKTSSVRMTFRMSARLPRQTSSEYTNGGGTGGGGGGGGLVPSELGIGQVLGINDFLGLWRDISETSLRLRGQSLQSMMILPIQRVPRYKLLLLELDKRITKEHPAKTHLTTALAQISQVATEINEALRRHQKLVALVGEQEMPQIAGASISNKSGKARLTVSYSSMRGAGG